MFKKVLLILLLIPSPFVSGSKGATFFDLWKLKSNTGVTKTWKLKKSKGVYASLSEESSYNTSEIKKIIGSANYLEEFKKEKIILLSFIGVSDWKINKYKWKKRNGQDVLEVSGSYQDRHKEIIDFVELHYFKKTKIIQMLYVAPKIFDSKSEYVESFFGKFSK